MRVPLAEEPAARHPVSRRLSACRHSLLGSSCARRRFGLPHGQLTRSLPGPRRGCHVPHEADATGVGALCTPGTVVRSRPAKPPRAAPVAFQRPAPTSRWNIPSSESANDEASTRVHAIHPSGLPQPVATGWNGGPWASPSGFAPRGYPRRTPRWGRSLRTGPDATSPASAEPPSTNRHCTRATSCRTIWFNQEACTGRCTNSQVGQASRIRSTERAPLCEEPLSTTQNTRFAEA